MAAKIQKVELDDIACKLYKEYATAVNEDRSVPGKIDGLKPVTRKLLWAAYKMGSTPNAKYMKAARIVGETMGKYHPHGDAGTYSGLVTIVNSPVPLFQGQGNWGNISSPSPAAMRYTEARVNKFSETIFFDRFYLPTIEYIANYDGSDVEPLNLPALLPNLLLNGTFGIGVGVSTYIPSFSITSIISVIKKALAGEKLDYKLCRKLKFTTKYGGESTAGKAEVKQLYKTGKGKISFKSIHRLEAKTNSIFITQFAPITSLERAMEKCANIKEVVRPNDISGKKDQYATVKIELKKSLKGKELEKTVDRVMDAFASNESFDIKVTTRTLDDKGNAKVVLSNSTVPGILSDWLKYRLELEVKACTYWIGKADVKIAYYNLLRKAVANKALILKALDKDCSEEELVKFIATSLKITEEEANKILDLKVRQLRQLEDKKLVAAIKQEEDEKAVLKGRAKRPDKYVATQLDRIAKLCKV